MGTFSPWFSLVCTLAAIERAHSSRFPPTVASASPSQRDVSKRSSKRSWSHTLRHARSKYSVIHSICSEAVAYDLWRNAIAQNSDQQILVHCLICTIGWIEPQRTTDDRWVMVSQPPLSNMSMGTAAQSTIHPATREVGAFWLDRLAIYRPQRANIWRSRDSSTVFEPIEPLRSSWK